MRNALGVVKQTSLLLFCLNQATIFGKPCTESWSEPAGNFQTERVAHFNRSIDSYLANPDHRRMSAISELVADRLAKNDLNELKLSLVEIERVIVGLDISSPQFHLFTLSKILLETAIRAYPPNPMHLQSIGQFVRSDPAKAILLRLKYGEKIEIGVLKSETNLSPPTFNLHIVTLRELGLIKHDLNHVLLTELGLAAILFEFPEGSSGN